MVRCPEHPDVALEKVMGQRQLGVWFPDFICPVDGKRFTYVDILQFKHKISKEEAERKKLSEAETISGFAGGGWEEMKRAVAEIVQRIFSPEEVQTLLRAALREPAVREELRRIIREELGRV